MLFVNHLAMPYLAIRVAVGELNYREAIKRSQAGERTRQGYKEKGRKGRRWEGGEQGILQEIVFPGSVPAVPRAESKEPIFGNN